MNVDLPTPSGGTGRHVDHEPVHTFSTGSAQQQPGNAIDGSGDGTRRTRNDECQALARAARQPIIVCAKHASRIAGGKKRDVALFK